MRRIAAARPFVILAGAWLWLFLFAHPGQMTQDSFDHLVEARNGVYTDGHPPIINLVFRICDHLLAGPLLMLVLQSTLFLAGLYLVFRRTFSPRGAAWAAAGVLIFPPVMLPMAVIWKDCIMAAFLVLGIAALLSEKRWSRVAGLACMFAATAVRYNAIGATLPLVVLLFEWRPGGHWLRRYALALAAWFAVTVAAFTVNAALTDKKMYIWHSSLAVYDIIGTLAFLDQDLPDPEMEELFAGTQHLVHTKIHPTARLLYDPRDFLPIISHETLAMWALPIYGHTPAPKEQRDAISRVWWNVISSHPVEYASHRLAVMSEVLSLTSSRPAGAIQRRDFKYPQFAHELGLATRYSKVQHRLTHWMSSLWKTVPIFVPWLYALIALAMLPLTRRHRDVFAILMSGLMMEGTLLFLAPSPDYRYSHWLVVATVIGIVMLTARRYRQGRSTQTGA